MNRLWTPWRMEYLSGRSRQVHFVTLQQERDEEWLVVYRAEQAYHAQPLSLQQRARHGGAQPPWPRRSC